MLDRRGFLTAAAVSFAGTAVSFGMAAKKSKRKPNVILILSDDQGTLDLNCYGSKDLYTPNLDELARSGVKFSQFYMAAPICSPSRGALLTGRYPNHNGVSGNGRAFAPDEITIAEMLKRGGYKTAVIGKWHLGEKPGPNAEGFDYFFGHLQGCINNYDHSFYEWDTGVRKFHDLWRNKKEIFEGETHFGELLVRESRDYIEKHKDEPFFMYLAFNNPHYPVQPLAHHLERYKKLPEPRRSYAAFVSTLDEQLGKIIGKVDELGLRKDTLIIFMSDHGHSVETRNDLWMEEKGDLPGGGNPGPYRGYKATVWEGGVRVPAIVSMPGKIPRNQTRDQIASSMDWYKTIAEFAGVELPDRKIDGGNLMDVINSADAPTPHKVLHCQFRSNWYVRQGKWKLVGNGPQTFSKNGTVLHEAELFLSDFSKDVTETKNLADKYPKVVQRLKKLHDDWLAEVGEPDHWKKAKPKKIDPKLWPALNIESQ